jgi:hypothetical protein
MMKYLNGNSFTVLKILLVLINESVYLALDLFDKLWPRIIHGKLTLIRSFFFLIIYSSIFHNTFFIWALLKFFYLLLQLINNLIAIFLLFLFNFFICNFGLSFFLNTHGIIYHNLTVFYIWKIQIFNLVILLMGKIIWVFLRLIFLENQVNFLLNFLSQIHSKILHIWNTELAEKLK